VKIHRRSDYWELSDATATVKFLRWADACTLYLLTLAASRGQL
jgi:hypothetical protein